MDHFCYSCFTIVFIIHVPPWLYLAALLSPAGKRLNSWLSVSDAIVCFCHSDSPIWCLRSGVVLGLSIPDLCLLLYFY